MDVMYNMINIINTTVCYMTFKGENPEFSSQGEKKSVFFSIALILNPHEMMNILYTFHDNHFGMYVSQIIMPYASNLHRAVCPFSQWNCMGKELLRAFIGCILLKSIIFFHFNTIKILIEVKMTSYPDLK